MAHGGCIGCGRVCPAGWCCCGVGENAGTKGIAACVLCGGGLINWASKSADGIAGGMVVAKDVQAIQQVKHQCGRCSKVKNYLTHKITRHGMMIHVHGYHVTTCLLKLRANELVSSRLPGHI